MTEPSTLTLPPLLLSVVALGVALWRVRAWQRAHTILAREQEDSEAPEDSEALVGALDAQQLASLDRLAREHDVWTDTVSALYETLDLVGSNIPGVAILLGVMGAQGVPIVEYAGGKLISDGGYNIAELIGMRVDEIPDTDPRLSEYYARGILGEKQTQTLSGQFLGEFVPVTHPDGRAMVLVVARLLI